MLQLTPDNVVVFRALGSSLYTYLLVLFGITLVSNYTQYFARKYHQVRIFSPLIYAFVPVVWLYVGMQILLTLSDPLKIPEFNTAAASIEQSLPIVYIFVLLLGYVILALNMSQEQRKKTGGAPYAFPG